MRITLQAGVCITALICAAMLTVQPRAALAADPPALSANQLPAIPGIENYIVDETAAILLGKALFWDMQVGSDGIQACASCHFQAGGDVRPGNTVAPGFNGVFDTATPNTTLTGAGSEFPFVQFLDVDDSTSTMIRDIDDIAGSQGLRANVYTGGRNPRDSSERGDYVHDMTFTVGGKNVRQVTGRNAPSVINAAFNFSQFWDGRAYNTFNGVNPAGEHDPSAAVWVNDGGVLGQETVRLEHSSLASQAVGPPMSAVEMAYDGRKFADIGHKLLAEVRRPLAKQMVHPNDSVLGPYSASPSRGLVSSVSYSGLIKQAFNARFWSSSELIDGYTQMEANFTLFWGLALQAYQRTLISDQTKYDEYVRGNTQLTAQELDGLSIFTSGGSNCSECHAGAVFSDHTATHIQGLILEGTVAPADSTTPKRQGVMASGRNATIDVGFFNIGVRPTGEDLGRGGGTLPDGEPLSFTLQSGVAPANAGVDGAFKTPTLRNVELNGPYMHTGGMSTLMQVVDFYARGGDFGVNDATNNNNIQDELTEIGTLIGDEQGKQDLVAFLLTLTDPRVKDESAPFDHPQLFLAVASPGDEVEVECTIRQIEMGQCDGFVELPAVGGAGRSAESLPPLTTFLDLDPYGRNGEKLNSGAGLQVSTGPGSLIFDAIGAARILLIP